MGDVSKHNIVSSRIFDTCELILEFERLREQNLIDIGDVRRLQRALFADSTIVPAVVSAINVKRRIVEGTRSLPLEHFRTHILSPIVDLLRSTDEIDVSHTKSHSHSNNVSTSPSINIDSSFDDDQDDDNDDDEDDDDDDDDDNDDDDDDDDDESETEDEDIVNEKSDKNRINTTFSEKHSSGTNGVAQLLLLQEDAVKSSEAGGAFLESVTPTLKNECARSELMKPKSQGVKRKRKPHSERVCTREYLVNGAIFECGQKGCSGVTRKSGCMNNNPLTYVTKLEAERLRKLKIREARRNLLEKRRVKQDSALSELTPTNSRQQSLQSLTSSVMHSSETSSQLQDACANTTPSTYMPASAIPNNNNDKPKKLSVTSIASQSNDII